MHEDRTSGRMRYEEPRKPMFEVRTDGLFAEIHLDRDGATLAAIGIKEADVTRFVTVHDLMSGHHWTVGGPGATLVDFGLFGAARQHIEV